MRIHKPLVDATILASYEILAEKKHASFVIKTTLAGNKKWGSRDRKFIAELILDVVRYFRYYKNLCEVKGETKKDFNAIVTCAVYIRYVQIPSYLNDYIDEKLIKKNLKIYDNNLAVKESYPKWINDLLETDMGKEQWEKEAIALNKVAMPVLRVNSLKCEIDKAVLSLNVDGVQLQKVKNYAEALVLNKRRDIRQTEAFRKGWVEIQDAGSQTIAPYLKLFTTDIFIDTCCGAGGKTLHAAAIMKNRGKIISMDIHTSKLKELRKRAKRAGVKNIDTEIISDKVIEKYTNKADKILLDVPCSGLGVLRRNPDDKWKLTPKRINELIKLQAELLQKYSTMLKQGGIMVYATCSIYSAENQQQIKTFIANNPSFKLDEEKQIFPSEGFDGFYMARLIKD